MRAGVDIGGTFTDLCIAGPDGIVAIGKALGTPAAPADSVETVLRDALEDQPFDGGDLTRVVHATTLVTNALIERKGAKIALLATAGFRDVIELARERRPDIYRLDVWRPDPLVPRHLRFDVPERTLADGTVELEVDVEDVAALAAELAERGVEAVAICFLHSFTNPANERAARDAVRRAAPDLRVALSSDIAPEIREYERTQTTAASVFVQDRVVRYLDDLEARLSALGAGDRLRVMLSNGGVATARDAADRPIRMLESGPAAGALAAARFAAFNGFRDLMSFDMGGTTAKLCLIEDGRPLVTHEFEAARTDRFTRGSGLPIKTPTIDMIEIGVGGGSLAHVDTLGLLACGPQSAGADPGPACYGGGGTRPTVTDADLVLGYLDAGFFLGGEMALDVEAARTAIKTHIADPLGLSVEEAAWGIHRLVNEDMASAARVHAAERGHDATGLPLFAFGGAGPVHAFGVGAALGTTTVIVPAAAGVMSSVGVLAAPLATDGVRSKLEPVDESTLERAEPLFAELEAQGAEILSSSGLADEDITHERSIDMRYVGQGFEVTVPIAPGEDLRAAFEAAYVRAHGRTGPDVPIEAISWRVLSRGPDPDLRLVAAPAGDGDARKGTRDVWFEDGYRETPIFDRYRMAVGTQVEGPAIVEERESTTVVGPGATARVAEDGSLIIEGDA
ncbi:hydantoinase/oxoprolinase family protein [Solirubrobacter sp. CPCC 204708]|uniref:Hydantoinase/oxoprolinase family protein n=1 Tax=Solirubrobacter deserti TaxID=2282478 RepID=A0ABT4RJC8_9ACTN|nr:hydantoinase/oxoprolinase family protein [Solirubrobacter deserti]MBE2317633.1 hydantoinase/oxoprolinase family protein [Solirubrobacter deserti]MDA0138583.1 hydantoinase/oxoprolinase family protein [Solirubrobacter deserti]